MFKEINSKSCITHVRFRLVINGARNRSTVFPVPRIHIIKSRYVWLLMLWFIFFMVWYYIEKEFVDKKKTYSWTNIVDYRWLSLYSIIITFIIVVVISVLLARILPIYDECIRTSATMTNIIEDFIYTYDTPTIACQCIIV